MSEVVVISSEGSLPSLGSQRSARSCRWREPRAMAEVKEYSLQAAGHRDTKEGRYTGLLQCSDGTVYKPILKEVQRREVDFYKRLECTDDPDLLELKQFVPKYFGTKKHTHNGFEQEYIILEDLTKGMIHPCVMDIKIGKRTWDHLASEAKIERERSKYSACKQQYSFCIPGYRAVLLPRAELRRSGKLEGGRLSGVAVVDAFRKFLNGPRVCRSLVLQVVSRLWRLQRWAAVGRRPRLAAASLLLLYDAAHVAACCKHGAPQKCRQNLITRSRTFHSLHSLDSFSGQLSSTGPIFRKVNSVPITNIKLHHQTAPPTLKSPWTDALDRLKTNHSFEQNYEDKLSRIKQSYKTTLEQLSNDSPVRNRTATVKLVDFAHAFFNDDEEPSVDQNFKEGIDSLVSIFEMLLKETDEQAYW